MTKLTTDEVKKYWKDFKQGNPVPEAINGVGLNFNTDENGTTATYGGYRYKIQGEKRVKVDEIKPTTKKAKKVKEVKPATTSVKCSKCGKKFDRSKFNPKQTECPTCRGSKSVPKQDTEKKCVNCGKPFMCSKFTPKKDTCPDCMKLARKARKSPESKKPAKPAKAKKDNKSATDGIPRIDIS